MVEAYLLFFIGDISLRKYTQQRRHGLEYMVVGHRNCCTILLQIQDLGHIADKSEGQNEGGHIQLFAALRATYLWISLVHRIADTGIQLGPEDIILFNFVHFLIILYQG